MKKAFWLTIHTHTPLLSSKHTNTYTPPFSCSLPNSHTIECLYMTSAILKTHSHAQSPLLYLILTPIIIFALQKYIYGTLYKYRVRNKNCVFFKIIENPILPISLHKECTVTSFRWPFTERPKAS